MTSFGEIISAAGTQSKEEFEQALIAALPPIYQKEDKDTIIRKLYQGLAEELAKADILVESTANNNYLSVPVVNEFIIRSSKERDRLQQENAFELDKIRLNPPGSVVSQNIRLTIGENTLQLFFIPEENIDFIIVDATDQARAPLTFATTFDPDTNILTIISDREGVFSVTYQDTGNVVRLNENITVPIGLFRLGWNEGGYSSLGYGE